ncbi:MAG: hypothetical protein AAFP90_21225 [Planctomycetota bacterium]
MGVDIPRSLSSLAEFLLGPLGFSCVADSTEDSFGIRTIVFELANYRLRFLRDRSGSWSIEFFESSKGSNWYYTALIREAVTGESADVSLSVDEEADYWKQNWLLVKKFFEPDKEAAHRLINEKADLISRRQNPSWYQ